MKAFRFFLALALSCIVIAPANAESKTIWNSQTRIVGMMTIPVGHTVTIAAKAAPKIAPGSQIIVNGTLLAPNGLTLVGKNWGGLIVNGSAQLSSFSESGAKVSFRVATGGKLIINGGTISGVAGASIVEGTFIADQLKYNKGEGGGINSYSGTGDITINNSSLTGAGRSSGDFFGLSGIKSITLSNSTMTGAHCAFHVTGLQSMKLDSVQIHDNAFGFMMYGSSGAGSRTITNTTITNNDFGFDEGSAATKNGAITITHSFIKKNGKDLGLYTGNVSVAEPLLADPFVK